MNMKSVKFKVFRYDPAVDKSPHFDIFEVPLSPLMSVLEGLYYIRENIDGSLAFRSACRAGVCGSCGMHINGKYRLACETQVKALNTTSVVIRPLSHYPIVRDLFINMDSFWKKYRLIKPFLMPGTPSPDMERPQSPDQRGKLDGLYECILCLVCMGSCPVLETNPNYLGPAILLKVDRFFQDSRDAADDDRLNIVAGNNGVFRCRTVFNCQMCPKSLDPTGSIANLKRSLVKRQFSISRLFS